MALNRKAGTNVVKKESDSEYIWDNLKSGGHEGRLVYVADLGLQEKSYAGEFQGNFQQLSLGIEIIGAGKEDKEGVLQPRILWTRPFWAYENGFTEKGTELELYSIFDESAGVESDADWEAQLDKVCSVNVENVNGTGENKSKVYDNIKSLDKIPEKYQEGVGASTVQCGIGDSEDKSNLVTSSLFGLPKFVHAKRIIEEVVEEEEAEATAMAEEKQEAPY